MTDRRVRLGAILTERHTLEAEPTATIEVAQHAEAAGWDIVYMGGHVILGSHSGDDGVAANPRAQHRPGQIPPAYPYLEPLTTLATLAGATRTIRLGTAILIAPLYQPVLLAKMAATIDVLSGGRLELGVASSWQEDEYRALGADFAGRGQRMDDLIEACRQLWSDSPASYHGPTLDFDDVWCEPKPVQPGGIPMWFGGDLHPPGLARIVRFGLGWYARRNPDVPAQVRRLKAALADAGRDPEVIDLIYPLRPVFGDDGRPDLDRTTETIPRMVEAGFTTFVTGAFAWLDRPGDAPELFGRIEDRFRTLGVR